jgi:putative transposase
MTYLIGRYEVSQRRACRVVQATRSLVYYQSRKDPLTALRQRMRELAPTRVRFGYRRLRVLLQREGWQVGKERFYRVYTEEGLALRRKRPWRHATAVHREQRRPAAARNDIWSMDFVADELMDGRKFRTLTVLDLYTRQCLDIAVGRGLNRAGCRGHARTAAVRSGIATARRLLRQRHGVRERRAGSMGLYERRDSGFRRRGKPTDNAAIESFNGRFRDECLNVHWFQSLEDATAKIEAWRQDYNENHPHRALKGLSPDEYARRAITGAADSP